MEREAWHAAVHGVTESWTRLSNWIELKVVCFASTSVRSSLCTYHQSAKYVEFFVLLERHISPLLVSRGEDWSILKMYLVAIYCLWGSPGKNPGVGCHSFLPWITFCQNSTTCPSWMALHSMAHSFIEFCKPLCYDKAVIHERISPMYTGGMHINKDVWVTFLIYTMEKRQSLQ